MRIDSNGFLSLCVLSMCVACHSGQRQAPTDPLERGRVALEQGRLAAAVEALERHRSSSPGDADVDRLLAQAYTRKGAYAKAIAAWQRVLVDRAKDGEAWRGLADLHYGLGDYQDAARAYRKAQEAGVLSLELVVRLAECQIQLRRANMALVVLETQGKAYAETASYQLVLGRALIGVGKPDAGIEALRKASSLAPKDPTPHFQIGAVYEALEFPKRAAVSYRRAIERHGEHAQALSRLGRVLLTLDKPIDAIVVLVRAVRLRPRDISVRNNLGVAQNQSRLYEDAQATFAEALRLNDDEPALHANMAEACFHLGEFAKAEAHLRRALALDGERTGDRQMLRRVVVMEVLRQARCAGSARAEQLAAALKQRYQRLGWTGHKGDLAELMKDRRAMALLQKSLQACGASE